MTLVIILGVLLAVGLLQLRWLAFPPTPDLVAEIERWRRGREIATQRVGDTTPPSPLGRLTRWVSESLSTYRPEFLDSLAPDLAITQRDLQTWLSKVTGLVLAFGIGPIVLIMGRRLIDADTSVKLAPVIGLVLGALAVALSLKDLRSEASLIREQYIWGLSIYLDLVAMSMEAGQGHASALPAAAQMGTSREEGGRVFTEIRTAIELAPSKGISAWEALGQLGERYNIPELISLRSSIDLAQDEGARVKASLIDRAGTMRKKRLAAGLERANTATESMRHLTMVAAFLAAIYIAAPYIIALRSAAGMPG